MMLSSRSKIQKDIQALETLGIGRVWVNKSLKAYTSWKIGGPADVLVEPCTTDQLSGLLQYIAENGLNYVTIGDGSNLLFDDAGFRGIVVKIGRAMSNCRISGTTVTVQAGIAVPRLARNVGVAGLMGIEHTVGIPGTLGGLVAMNGGSQRKGIGEVVKTVHCVDPFGHVIEFQEAECQFSYRHSVFLEKPWIVTDVVLSLQQGNREEILAQMLEILRDRRRKFPRRLPNCGSVFKSDPVLYEKCGPPGKVIEELGFKGFSVGDAQVSPLHANFIVNTGNARAADVLQLIQLIRDKVHQKTDIWLDCEVRYISPEGGIQAPHVVD